MSGWRSNPVVGVIAGVVIVAAVVFILRQVFPDRGIMDGHRTKMMIHQGGVMADETAKLLRAGGLTVLIASEGKLHTPVVKAFQERAAAGNLEVRVVHPKPITVGTDGGPTPVYPEMEGLQALVDAIKAHPDAKCCVNLIGLSMGPMVFAETKLPEQVETWFSKGGKLVTVTGGAGTPIEGAEDPLLSYVEDGQAVLIAPRPYTGRQSDRDIVDGPVGKQFDQLYFVVTKERLAEYRELQKKAMSLQSGGARETK